MVPQVRALLDAVKFALSPRAGGSEAEIVGAGSGALVCGVCIQ